MKNIPSWLYASCTRHSVLPADIFTLKKQKITRGGTVIVPPLFYPMLNDEVFRQGVRSFCLRLRNSVKKLLSRLEQSLSRTRGISSTR